MPDTTASPAVDLAALAVQGIAMVTMPPTRVFSGISPRFMDQGASITISATAYFSYIGYTLVPLTPAFVRFVIGAAGAGAQTAEIGLFSSPVGPNGAGQNLTPLVATGTLTNLTAGFTAQRNNVAFATVVPPGTHLWAGLRTAMAVTQPSVYSTDNAILTGEYLVLVGSGVLTGAGPFAGVLPAQFNSPNPGGVFLTVTLD